MSIAADNISNSACTQGCFFYRNSSFRILHCSLKDTNLFNDFDLNSGCSYQGCSKKQFFNLLQTRRIKITIIYHR